MKNLTREEIEYVHKTEKVITDIAKVFKKHGIQVPEGIKILSVITDRALDNLDDVEFEEMVYNVDVHEQNRKHKNKIVINSFFIIIPQNNILKYRYIFIRIQR